MNKRHLAVFAFVTGFAISGHAVPAAAQSSLDDIVNALDGRSAELARAQALLDDPDPNRRIAAMELLIKSDDEQFRRLAREFGLFSSDPVLRQTALLAILGAGGGFRLETDAPREGSTGIAQAVAQFSGTLDAEGKGSIPFVLRPGFDGKESCWLNTNNRCTLQLAGSTVHIPRWVIGSTSITGSFELDDAGNLAGHVLVRGQGNPVAARIPLID